MTTISNALLNNAGSAASTLAGLKTPQGAASATNLDPAAQSAVQGQTTFTPSVANQLASLTYSSAGTLHSAPQTQASAQAAYVAAETAITQSLSDLMSGSSSGSSGASSGTDMFGASTSTTSNNSTGLLNNLPSGSASGTNTAATDTKAQVAQKAYIAAQDAVTQAQGSLIK
jgi:hypothetical protein